MYQFGGGECRFSTKKIGLPAIIGGMKLTILTEVIDADIPLLIGANSLEKSDAILDFGEMKAQFFSVHVPIMKVGSGHYCITILPDSWEGPANSTLVEEEIVLYLKSEDGELTFKELQKLHHICGHASTDKILKLVVDAGKEGENSRRDLMKIKETCESRNKNNRSVPKPKFSLPRATRFNEIVTKDLKEYDKDDAVRRYICYLIDMHTRFLVANFIPSKKPCQIVQTIVKKWIGAGYGVMNAVHNDLGGEMTNEELMDVASKLDIQMTTTAAYSPHQNGVNERNHHTVDLMMKKMLDSDAAMAPDDALFWSVNAKNSLENYSGFSPYQLVFASNPKFPSVTQCGPPGYENRTVSEIFAKDMNALHRARQEFVKAELQYSEDSFERKSVCQRYRSR